MAEVALMSVVGRPESRRELFVDTLLRGAAIVLLLAGMLVIAARPEIRARIDATRSRAYSLSAQTELLLAGLDGEWTIAVLLGDGAADDAVRRQISEVLRRYEERGIAVRLIDPVDPGSAAAYETLLSQLRTLEAARIERCERVMSEGFTRLRELILFAQEATPQLQQLLAMAGDVTDAADSPNRGPASGAESLQSLDVLAAQGDQILDAAERAYGIRELKPVPDYETTRSILAAALGQYAEEFDLIAEAIPRWLQPLGSAGAALIRQEAQRFQTFAGDLAAAADDLQRLDVPEFAAMAGAMERGDFAVIIGPHRAALVPPEQLFPRIQVDSGEAGTAFDRRFRGEQVLSAAIRSLLVDEMPLVIFMHAEERSMMRVAGEQRIDLVGARTLLEASRFHVREWIVGSGERPALRPGQRAVYLVVPPPERRGLEPTRRELLLIDGVRELIGQGEAVLLSVWPSPLPRYRRPDPWAPLAEPFGMRPETDRVVYEAVDVGEGRSMYQQGQAIDRRGDAHLISEAMEGLQAFLVFPVPLSFREDAPVLSRARLMEVDPSPRRWLERQWAGRVGVVEDDHGRGEALPGSVTIVASAERLLPGGGRQRFLLAGSGGWMHSYVLDAVTSLGGGRVALTNPGNQEFLLAGVQWLAEMDDLIAPSPVSRQVSRLSGLDRRTSARWALVGTVGVPAGLLALAFLMFLVRRR